MTYESNTLIGEVNGAICRLQAFYDTNFVNMRQSMQL